MFDHNEAERAKVTDINKYMDDKWMNTTKITTSRSMSNLGLASNSFRVSNVPSDHDSIKYMNHRESKTPVDEKSRMKRMMSSFGIQDSRNIRVDSTTVEHRVQQWLVDNEMNFGKFCHMQEEELSMENYRKEEATINANLLDTRSSTKSTNRAGSVKK